MADNYRGWLPIIFAEKFVPLLREHRLLGDAETLAADIKRRKQEDASRTWDRENGGSVHVVLPDVMDADLCQRLASVLMGEKSKPVRTMYLELTRLAAVLTSDDPMITATEKMPMAVTKYLNAACKLRGWLYSVGQDDAGNDTIFACLPTDIDWHTSRDDGKYCTLKTIYNGPTSGGHSDNRPIYKELKEGYTWSGHEAVNQTASMALRRKNLYAETQALQDEYDATTARYHEVRNQGNELFRVSGTIRRTSSRSWSERTYLATKAKPALIVNDETLVTHEPSDFAHSSIFQNSKLGKQRAGTLSVPYHPLVYGFDMNRHETVWGHAGGFEEFVYLDIADKLVLPPEHNELVDAVVHDLGFVAASDIVGDKGTGTPVLSIGKPGEGKTLLAEVIGHRLHRPLYKINAGYLLGDDDNRVTNVENTLQTMLQRCERQKLIPLIDEADVMIATRRADNLTQAAIVAAFLRTLEYFNGLLFLTSNRADIDDAVLSRMAAVIKFRPPTGAARAQIWAIQAEAQGTKLSPKLIDQLAKLECSGRDINRLLSLALRYELAGKAKLTFDLFKRIAVFRGIDVGN